MNQTAADALTGYEKNLLENFDQWLAEYLVPGSPAPVADSDGPLLLLCMTPRSGSSALSAALAGSKQIGLGGERLSRKPNGPLANLLKERPCATLRQILDLAIVCSRTRNGVAQIKCDFQQIYPFLADPSCLGRLRMATWVYLTREDLLGQAISRFRGFKTGFWHSTGSARNGGSDTEYDFDGIRKQVIFLAEMMAAFERTFAAI